jgi:uncharacterized membrane protein YciS (DUF1049 family)
MGDIIVALQLQLQLQLQLLLAILFFGGLIGWTLFGLVTFKIFKNQDEEVKLISELREEIKEIRKEVQTLK